MTVEIAVVINGGSVLKTKKISCYKIVICSCGEITL